MVSALFISLTFFMVGTFSVVFAASQYYNSVLAAASNRTVLLAEAGGGGALIYDRNGELLHQVFDPNEGYRTHVSLSEVSPNLIQATLAAEDPTFYENAGIDIKGILRAAWQNWVHQDIVQGGSSITQQLVKNVLLPETERNELSIARKSKEAILALDLTQRYSKDELLTLYLNEIYYGNLSYGIEAAAQGYFGKNAKDLTLPEAAMLAGIPQSPSKYSPMLNPEAAIQRQHNVLDLMVRHGMLKPEEAEAAKEVPLEYHPVERYLQAPHFVMYVEDLLEQKYGTRAVLNGGFKVITSIDMNLQRMGEELVRDQVAKTARTINARNAALVSIRPSTGEILTMVGSANYDDPSIDGQVNIATSERQPGSSFKPLTYVTAFMKGYTPATIINDAPIVIRDGFNRPWAPQNVDRQFHGRVSIRHALGNSMNIPAVKTIEYTGVEAVLNTAHKMGITDLNRKNFYGLALTLGGGEVKLLDLTYAYAVFANQGLMAGAPVPPERQVEGMRKVDPVAILRIEDANGRIIEQFDQPATDQVLPPEYAYLITDILSDYQARQPLFGNTLSLPGNRPAAVKTGTTDDLKDFWTMGYTPDLATGVWMGNTNNRALTGGFSSTTTGPIWLGYMAAALEGTPHTKFEVPENVVRERICGPTGLLATPGCNTGSDVFVKGQLPKRTDPTFVRVTEDVKCGGDEPDGVLASDRSGGRGANVRPGAVPASLVDQLCAQAGRPTAATGGATGDVPAPAGGGVTVPNVVGRSEGDARAALAAAGTPGTPFTNYQTSANLPPSLLQAVCVGCVLSITPSPGTPVPPGTPINIAVRGE